MPISFRCDLEEGLLAAVWLATHFHSHAAPAYLERAGWLAGSEARCLDRRRRSHGRMSLAKKILRQLIGPANGRYKSCVSYAIVEIAILHFLRSGGMRATIFSV